MLAVCLGNKFNTATILTETCKDDEEIQFWFIILILENKQGSILFFCQMIH